MSLSKLTLRAKLLIASALVLTITVIVVILFNYFSMYNNYLALYKNFQNRVAKNISSLIAKELNKDTSGLIMFAKSVNGDTTKDIVERYGSILDETRDAVGISSIIIAFDDGVMINTSNISLGGDYDHRNENWYKEARKHNGIYKGNYGRFVR